MKANGSYAPSAEEVKPLGFLEKTACTIGAMISTFNSQMIQMFLLFFYAEIQKLPPLFISTLFLAVRLLNAFIGPAFGVIMDRVKLPWGKYKPWILICSFPIALFGILNFMPIETEPIPKMIYAAASYLLFGTFLSLQQVASSGMGPSITKSVKDRLSIGRHNFIWIIVGSTFVSIGGRPIYLALGQGKDGKGLALLMCIAAVIGILVALFQVSRIHERYITPHSSWNLDMPFRDVFHEIITNRTALIAYANIFASSLTAGVRSAVTILFLKYYFHNEALLVPYGTISLAGTLVGVFLSGTFTRKVGLRNNLVISIIIQILAMAALFAAPPNGLGEALFIISSTLFSIFIGLATPAQGTLLPTAMDYTEWKSGHNLNSFMGSLNGSVGNIAIAISGGIAAGALSIIGYVPGIEQSNETLIGLKILMSLLPAILMLPALLVIRFDLSEEKQHHMARALIAKNLGISHLTEKPIANGEKDQLTRG